MTRPTLKEFIQISKKLYKTKKIDNKERRAKLDIKNGKLSIRKNLVYNRSTKKWEQQGNQIKFVFIVSSSPVSYIKTDTIKIHKYPVTFLIDKFEDGVNTTFRWRTGSNYKPKLKRGSHKKKENLADYNIRKGIQLQFFFHLEWILSKNKLLVGPNRTNGAPKVTNPKGLLYFDKTAWFVATKILVPILTKKKSAILKVITKIKH